MILSRVIGDHLSSLLLSLAWPLFLHPSPRHEGGQLVEPAVVVTLLYSFQWISHNNVAAPTLPSACMFCYNNSADVYPARPRAP